jgi:hypothetical protein
MKALTVVCALLLMTGLAMAADVTGKWVAQVPGRGGETREVVYNLKSSGGTLTGTTTGMGGQEVQLSDGKIDGDNISFSIKMERNGNAMVMLYKGKVSGDEIKFTQQREGSENVREFAAKRAK